MVCVGGVGRGGPVWLKGIEKIITKLGLFVVVRSRTVIGVKRPKILRGDK